MNGKQDFLPEIEEPPVENINMVINEVPPEVEDDKPVDKPIDNVDEKQIEEEPVPVKPRKKLEQREIFRPPKVQEIISSTTGKPKRKMSEKQLAHLAKIREKGLETRMRNKKLREEGKAEEISKKVQKENVRIQEKIIKEKEKLTNLEIEDITINAINKYEMIRKARKQKKREEQERERKEKAHMEHVNHHLNSAINSQQRTTDIWDSVLSGMWK
jgi:hypothetical protein